MKIARKLQDIALEDPDGKPHRLGDLWSTRPTLLVFIRHFG